MHLQSRKLTFTQLKKYKPMSILVIKRTSVEEKVDNSISLNDFLFSVGTDNLFIKSKKTNEVVAISAGRTMFYNGQPTLFLDLICDEIDDNYAAVFEAAIKTLNELQLKALHLFFIK